MTNTAPASKPNIALTSSSIDMGQELKVNGAQLFALKSKALWWPEKKVLIVSDLHLEKGSSYARRGQLLPPFDTAATLKTVADLITELQPQCVISLGDSFHDARAEERLAESDTARIRKMTEQTDWCWVEGNHDPLPPEGLGGRSMHELRIGPLVFRHEPLLQNEKGEIAGHLHPCAKVKGKTGRAVRASCFISNEERLIMPAMGAFTGGLNVLDPAIRECFPNNNVVSMVGRDGVYPVKIDRLCVDREKRSSRWRLQ